MADRVVRAHRVNSEFRKEGCILKFTLSYEGKIKTSGASGYKHEFRKYFHPQLRRLWSTNPFLMKWAKMGENNHPILMKDHVPTQICQLENYKFLPLVTKELCLDCALEIRFLRHTENPKNEPDIDNLLKPLFDGLRKPNEVGQLGKYKKPDPDENPFFVLLDDDSLISKVTSVTDQLLQPIEGKPDIESGDFRVLIDVYIRPTLPIAENQIFYSDNNEVWDHRFSVPENLTELTSYQLKAMTTQLIFRIRAFGEHYESANSIYQTPAMNSIIGGELEVVKLILDDEETWRRELRPKAFAIRHELRLRIYGEGPYPSFTECHVLDNEHFAGIFHFSEAADVLDRLIRILR